MPIDTTQSLSNRYRLDLLLGRGGMGSVFRAYDLELQRMVAVKVMHPHLAVDPSFRERFLQEARVGARLKHPSIVAIYDQRADGEQLYLVME